MQDKTRNESCTEHCQLNPSSLRITRKNRLAELSPDQRQIQEEHSSPGLSRIFLRISRLGSLGVAEPGSVLLQTRVTSPRRLLWPLIPLPLTPRPGYLTC